MTDKIMTAYIVLFSGIGSERLVNHIDVGLILMTLGTRPLGKTNPHGSDETVSLGVWEKSDCLVNMVNMIISNYASKWPFDLK